MKIAGSVALITGANRGLGREYVVQLLERGAAKVYAAARRPETVDVPGVEALRVDVTDPASMHAAASVARDVTLLVTNAGVSTGTDLLTGDLDKVRLEMDTNFYGTLHTVRAFAPVLGANGGGAVVTMLSRMSWLSYPGVNAYSATKAAAWSLTNGVRLELAAQGTLVTGVMLATTDTDMSAAWDIPKNDPADVVRAALEGVEAGRLEVIADADTAAVKAALSGDPAELYPDVVRGGYGA
jgi:NAD(P)-dependent dehydrogenase (short-subunit alcohol dehydrogenase family)